MQNYTCLVGGVILSLVAVGAAQARSTTLTGNSCNVINNASYDPSSPAILNNSTSATAKVICPIPLISPSTSIPAAVKVDVAEYNASGALSCNLRSYNQAGSIVGTPEERGTSTSYTGATTLTFSGLTIQAGGHLVVECSLPANTASGKSLVKHIKLTY